MPSHLAHIRTDALLTEVAELETRLILGTTLEDEIDRYVVLQLELAERSLLEMILDPRD